jgi:hypothetical protein
MKNDMRIIHVSDLPLGGFAGIVEKQVVISHKLKKSANLRTDISLGLGGLIYLSTGHFKPNDGAPLHPHDNVDIVPCRLLRTKNHHFAALRFPDFQRRLTSECIIPVPARCTCTCCA